ncbi:hypothetical protein IV203_021270 [Nitzschia inconspicua]|uniref:Uncharacterized protein n=1 Tax=Nitzschia inconspicua TaxID=303405 RepID=A0A9K3KGV0_9STRA|nr:hypothetical protein IV203_021270 [Nitzschia inconspicua]
MAMTGNVPATPCTQALLRLTRMKLEDTWHYYDDEAEVPNANAQSPPLPHNQCNGMEVDDDESSSIFQTPSTTRRRKLSFVVTPPRLGKQTMRSEEGKTHEHLTSSSQTDNSEQRSSNTFGRKRTRGGVSVAASTAGVLPPMLPASPELFAPAPPTSTFGRRLLPIHSPIAGISGTLNMEFVAKLKEEEGCNGTEERRPSSPKAILQHRESFLARHAFPILEDEEDPERNRTFDGTLPCTRALKMRRRIREEDYDGLLRAERELLS